MAMLSKPPKAFFRIISMEVPFFPTSLSIYEALASRALILAGWKQLVTGCSLSLRLVVHV